MPQPRREKKYQIAFTPDEFIELERVSELTGQTVANFIRQSIKRTILTDPVLSQAIYKS